MEAARGTPSRAHAGLHRCASLPDTSRPARSSPPGPARQPALLTRHSAAAGQGGQGEQLAGQVQDCGGRVSRGCREGRPTPWGRTSEGGPLGAQADSYAARLACSVRHAPPMPTALRPSQATTASCWPPRSSASTCRGTAGVQGWRMQCYTGAPPAGAAAWGVRVLCP